MQLIAHPSVINFEFFFQFVDNTFADIAEWSNIVGKNFKVDHGFFLLDVIV